MNEVDETSVATATAHDSCIICLSNIDYANCSYGSIESLENGHSKNEGHVEIEIVEKSNTPLMDIRVLCGNRDSNEKGVCNCRYNIHTSCFVDSNKVFNNVCPMCRNNWWCDKTEPDTRASDSHEVSSSNFTRCIYSPFWSFTRYCPPILALFCVVLIICAVLMN